MSLNPGKNPLAINEENIFLKTEFQQLFLSKLRSPTQLMIAKELMQSNGQNATNYPSIMVHIPTFLNHVANYL